MVEVTRLNGTKLTINPYQIEHMEETPDTVIVFQTGHKLVVKEKTAEIADRWSDFFSESVRKGILRSREG